MLNTIKKLSKALERIWDMLLYVAVVMMVALLAICACTVLLRKVFIGGFNWSDEAMRYLMVYATFLSLPYLVSKKKNITIDLTDLFFSKHAKGRFIFLVVSEILTLICCLALLPTSITFIALNISGYSNAMRLPLWLVYLCMPIGLGLSAIASINNLTKLLVIKEEA
ncbi:TRAP transporter small permease subunit [uncultured Flavonifractor sp.]|uniref:TRAP transporter small permease n=1 Tax=uncultured Flavonifractor sp. TaxID=1193534 RepID=UPI0025ECF903|nr:TRAP transporter small permease subunit [uncultured Flavonifractor sp.]